MNANDLPIPVLIRSFLQAMTVKKVEAVVVAMPTRNGVNPSIASNAGDAAVQRARIMLAVPDGAIERVAQAVHEFRLIEQGKQIEPEMDICSFLPCAGGGGKTSWAELPNQLKEVHRVFAKVILAAIAQPAEPPSPLVV